MAKTKIFSNTATQHIFDKISNPDLKALKEDLKVVRFSDGEFYVEFPSSIRGCDIFVLADTSHNLTELLFTIDAAHRASVKSITIVLPYYGYGRQDRKGGERVSVGAAVMATVLQKFCVNRIVSIDLHASQIEGFFNIPIEHLKGHSIFLETLKSKIKSKKVVICSPDAGGTKRASAFSSKLECPMVTMNKRRDKPNSIESMELLGNVKGAEVWIVDDMVDTCGTLCKAAEYLKTKGAKKVSAIATHGILSGKAEVNLKNDALSELIISDTVLYPEFVNKQEKITVVSCIDVLEKAILKIINEESLSELNK